MRARWIVAIVVAAVVLLPMVFVAGIYVTHPRDENDFMGALHNSAYPKVWTSFVDDHDQKFLVDEGDRACTWLSEQPIAFLSSASRYDMGNVMDRYLTETKEDPAWDLKGTDFASRRVVAFSAWNHLCEATLLVHRPYHPFGDPEGGSDK